MWHPDHSFPPGPLVCLLYFTKNNKDKFPLCFTKNRLSPFRSSPFIISTGSSLDSNSQYTVLFGRIFDSPRNPGPPSPTPEFLAKLLSQCFPWEFLEAAVLGPAGSPQETHLLPQRSGSCRAMERGMILEAWLSRQPQQTTGVVGYSGIRLAILARSKKQLCSGESCQTLLWSASHLPVWQSTGLG